MILVKNSRGADTLPFPLRMNELHHYLRCHQTPASSPSTSAAPSGAPNIMENLAVQNEHLNLPSPNPNPPTAEVATSTIEISHPDQIPSLLQQLLPRSYDKTTTPQVQKFEGGITNTIYTARTSSCTFLIRIFGSEDVFTSRQRQEENRVYKRLSDAGIAPTLHAVFGNGRVETFLDARSVSLEEMVDEHVADGVAQSLKQLHAFRDPDKNFVPGVWKVLGEWATQVAKLCKEGKSFGDVDVSQCVKCLNHVEKQLMHEDQHLVFAHNDLLAGNIMLSSTGHVSFVDFEYSSYNPRAFDIANYFCECMGGTVDAIIRTELYPDEAFRRRFCARYLEKAEDSKEVEELVAQVERFVVVPHLYWGFWALLQSVGSDVAFDYAKFGAGRLKLALGRRRSDF